MEKRLLNHIADKVEMPPAAHKASVRDEAGVLAPRTIQCHLATGYTVFDTNRGRSAPSREFKIIGDE